MLVTLISCTVGKLHSLVTLPGGKSYFSLETHKTNKKETFQHEIISLHGKKCFCFAAKRNLCFLL